MLHVPQACPLSPNPESRASRHRLCGPEEPGNQHTSADLRPWLFLGEKEPGSADIKQVCLMDKVNTASREEENKLKAWVH